jgi:hypothetical protein
MSPTANQHPPNYSAPNQNAASARTRQNRGQMLRECVTAAISLLIVLLALFFLWDAYYAVKTGANTFAELKDVLTPALGLLGTVIGYYFGRLPAERHADTARDAANAAHERELKVRQQVHAGLADIQQKHNRTEGTGPDAVHDAINQLRSSLF